MRFAGNMVALVTPMRNGEVDYPALEGLVEQQILGGVSALVPCGTTGESPTLSHEEHNAVVEAVVRMAADRVAVMAGAGSNSTAEALSLCRHAEAIGASALLVVAPYYNKPSQEGLLGHFRTLAEGTGLPICLYNIPSRCAVEISVETMARLAEHPRIQAVKEATGSMENTSRIRSLTDLAILAGDDALTLPIMALGGTGVVSVLSNLLPEAVSRLANLVGEGDLPAARELHRKLFPLMRALFIESNPVPVKTALASLGRMTAEVRPPLAAMEQENRRQLLQVLREHV